MKITDEELDKFIEELTQLNNCVENMLTTVADVVIALQGQLRRVEELLDVLAKIAQQPAEDPS